jgi:hypothetical protein
MIERILGWFGYCKTSTGWTVIAMNRRWPWMGRFSPGGKIVVFTGPGFETLAAARAWKRGRLKVGAKYAFCILTGKQEIALMAKLGYTGKRKDPLPTEEILIPRVTP